MTAKLKLVPDELERAREAGRARAEETKEATRAAVERYRAVKGDSALTGDKIAPVGSQPSLRVPVREIEAPKRPPLALSVVYGRLRAWLSLGSIAGRWQVTVGEIEEAERQRKELERG